jgi:hypothetical protein
MFKLIRSLQLFKAYKKGIKINEQYLFEKYGLNIDLVDRLWTVMDLSDAPKEMIQQYGAALSDYEYNKYIKTLLSDLPRLELNELVNIYEVKKVDKNKFGITFGFSQFNNVTYYVTKWAIIGSLIAIGIISLIIIF